MKSKLSYALAGDAGVTGLLRYVSESFAAHSQRLETLAGFLLIGGLGSLGFELGTMLRLPFHC